MIRSSSSTDGPQADKVDLHEGRIEAFTDRAREKAYIALVSHSDT